MLIAFTDVMCVFFRSLCDPGGEMPPPTCGRSVFNFGSFTGCGVFAAVSPSESEVL